MFKKPKWTCRQIKAKNYKFQFRTPAGHWKRPNGKRPKNKKVPEKEYVIIKLLVIVKRNGIHQNNSII